MNLKRARHPLASTRPGSDRALLELVVDDHVDALVEERDPVGDLGRLPQRLPVRFYLPAEDVRTDLLQPSDKQTFCAYKGQASYWSLDGEDVAWTYVEPLREAAEVTGRVAFFNEHADVVVDGERVERPLTPWSRR